MAAHCHVALGRTLTNNDDRRSATLNPRLGGLKCMRANRHHYAPKSLDSCRAKPERETQPEGAPDNPPSARRCRPNRSESADHAASARPREYGGFNRPNSMGQGAGDAEKADCDFGLASQLNHAFCPTRAQHHCAALRDTHDHRQDRVLDDCPLPIHSMH